MIETWRIRPAEPGDAEQILAVSDEAAEWLVGHGLSGQWGDELPSSEAAFVSRVSGWIRDGESMVAADAAGDVQGYMVFGCFPPPYLEPEVAQRAVEDAAYVYTLASRMRPESRGVGRNLLVWATGWARSCGVTYLRLDCWAGNPGLRAYYENLGFAECEAYVEDGWHGIIMQMRV